MGCEKKLSQTMVELEDCYKLLKTDYDTSMNRTLNGITIKKERVKSIVRFLKITEKTPYSETIDNITTVLVWFLNNLYNGLEVKKIPVDNLNHCFEFKAKDNIHNELIDVSEKYEDDILSMLIPTKVKTVQRKHIPSKQRIRILERDNYTCQMCGKTTDDGVRLEIDHIIPFSKGGTNEDSNLQVLCSVCNNGKRDNDCLLHDKQKLESLEEALNESI